MKITKLRSAFLSVLLILTATFSGCQNRSLKDITKPYLGIYECKQATLNGKDYLDYFKNVTLELKQSEDFILRYEDKMGATGEYEGKYIYNKEEESLSFTIDGEEGYKRQFPWRNKGLGKL